MELARRLRRQVRSAASQETVPELAKRRIEKALQSQRKESGRPIWSKAMVSAAAVVLVFLFVLGSSLTSSRQAQALAQAVGHDHLRCCRETRQHPVTEPSELARQHFGSTPELVSLPDHYQVFDCRICPLQNGQEALHILYKDARYPDQVVSLFGLPSRGSQGLKKSGTEPEETARLMNSSGGVRVAAWRYQGWVFSLAAEVPPDRLRELLQHIHYVQSLQTRQLAGLPRR